MAKNNIYIISSVILIIVGGLIYFLSSLKVNQELEHTNNIETITMLSLFEKAKEVTIETENTEMIGNENDFTMEGKMKNEASFSLSCSKASDSCILNHSNIGGNNNLLTYREALETLKNDF